MAAQLRAEGIDPRYEEDVVPYIRPARKAKYHPDFVLPNGIVIETKGRFVVADRQKHVLIKQQHPELDIRFVFSNSLASVIHNRMFFYDHFGSLDSENLLSKLRYLAVSCGVDFIILDHISIVVSGQESSSEGERKDIDRLMTKLRSLVEETGVGVIAIVHLNKPDGAAHEEGGRVTLSNLRGSGSLKQLSDNVLAMERDQQGEAPSVSMMRLLKNREFGEVGPADYVRYDKLTGRLLPHDPEGVFEDETGADDDIPF